jgi:protein import protein ZIM17
MERLSDRTDVSAEDKALFRKAIYGKAQDSPSASKDRMGGAGVGPASGEMVAAFTCEVCNARSVKRFQKHCYLRGVVIIQCPGCSSKHLLADHMGWFEDDGKTIEEILKLKGEAVTKIEGVHIDE